MIELGKFIRAHGFTQVFIAAQLGMSRQNFSRIATGNSGVSIPLIYRLAEIMGLPIAEVAAAVIPELKGYVYAERTQGGERLNECRDRKSA